MLLHYFLLAAFGWMAMEVYSNGLQYCGFVRVAKLRCQGYNLYKTFVLVLPSHEHPIPYFLLGWGALLFFLSLCFFFLFIIHFLAGIPFVIVMCSLVSRDDYGTETDCWIDRSSDLIWAFYGPLLCIVVFNVAMSFLVLR